jgi:hypothetical protein
MCYLFFNVPLARIDNDSGIYIDNYHFLAIGDTFEETNQKIVETVTREGGVNEWGMSHNSIFGAAKDH